MNLRKAIRILGEFNKWRRGEGIYQWNEDPAKNRNLPYSPTEIGEAIDEVLRFHQWLSDQVTGEARYGSQAQEA